MTVSPQSTQVKAGMGTPQLRWREMHQSGLPSTIEPMRLTACAGKKATCLSASSACSRRPVSSIETNHWLVARKMTGFLHLQQCG